MGMVFQEPMTSLNPLMSIGRQIAEAVTLHDDLIKRAVNQRVIELLQAVAIPDPERCIHRYPHQLSRWDETAGDDCNGAGGKSQTSDCR